MHLFAETHPQSQQSVKCAQTAVSNVIMEPIRGQAVKAYPNIWSCFSHDFNKRQRQRQQRQRQRQRERQPMLFISVL